MTERADKFPQWVKMGARFGYVGLRWQVRGMVDNRAVCRRKISGGYIYSCFSRESFNGDKVQHLKTRRAPLQATENAK